MRWQPLKHMKARHKRTLRRRLLAALLCATPWLFFATPANADPISDAIVLIYATIAALTTTEIIAGIILLAVSAGIGFLERALAGDNAKVQGVNGTINTGGTTPRSFIVGTYATAGSLTYVNTWGNDGKTPNAYLTMVVAISDIPIGGILTGSGAGLVVNDVGCTYGAPTETDMGYPIPECRIDGQDYMWVKFYDGTQTAADDFLQAKFGSDPNYPYDSGRIGYGIAYAICTFRVNQTLFSGFPRIKFVVEGATLYDPRDDSTAGGDGVQTFDNPASWQYSANPIVVAYNILRGMQYSGDWFYGLQNLTAYRVPYDSWSTAMNNCDYTVSKYGGTTSGPQYICGGEIQVNIQIADVLDELFQACNTRIAECGGSYKVLCGAVGSSVYSFDDSGIVIDQSAAFVPFPSSQSTINSLQSTYPEPSQAWENVDAPNYYDATAIAEDGETLIQELDYPLVPDLDQVERLMASTVLEAREFRQHVFYLPPNAQILEPNDTVTYSSTKNGYSNKLFRVQTSVDADSLDVQVTLVECDPDDYSWDSSTQFVSGVDGPLSVAGYTPPTQGMGGFTAAGVTLLGDGGQAKSAIQLTWDIDVDDVQAVLYQVQLSSDDSEVNDGEIFNWGLGLVNISANILSATTYRVRAQYLAASARLTTWSSWLTVTTPDVRISAIDLAPSAVDWVNLATDLFNDNVQQGLNIRTLLGQVQNLSSSVSELGLGTLTDIQQIYVSLVSTTNDLTASYTSAIEAATGPTSALATDITDLEATLDGYSPSSTVASAITGLTATVNTQGDAITANTSSITSLSSTIGGTYSPTSTVATAISTLNTTVTTQGSAITSNSSAITTLSSTIGGTLSPTNTVASALSGLTTTVTSQGGTITSNSTAITSLSNTIGGTYSPTSTVSTAISGLSSTVSSQGSSITSLASSITTLNAQVGNVYASGLFRVSTAATASGADASIELQVAASGGGGGYTASMFMDAMTGGNSQVRFVAGSFIITDGSTTHAPFTFTGGVLTVNNAYIANLTTGNLQSGAATAPHVSVGGVNSIGTSFGNIGGAITFTTVGGTCQVTVYDTVTWTGSGPSLFYQVLLDGSAVFPVDAGGGTCPNNILVGGTTFITGISAGSHTWQLQAKTIGGSSVQGNNGVLTVTEFRA